MKEQTTTVFHVALLGLCLAGYWKLSLTAAVISLVLFLFRLWMQGPQLKSNAQLEGKTVVITGANSGIGKITAMDLSKRGPGW